MIKISNNLTDLILAYERFWSENTFSKVVGNNVSYNINPKMNYANKLKDLISKIHTETYYQYILKLMNEKNLTSVEIYTKALISKEQFSKIIGGKNNRKPYIPKKQWLLRIAFAMELSFDETTNLLNKAGHAFIEFDKSDFVFIFFLKNKIYEPCDIEDLLKHNNLPSLYKCA